MNGLICSGGGTAYKVEVGTGLTEVVVNSPATKFIRITNLGANAVFLGPAGGGVAADTGIVLEPYGNPNDFIEFNNNNMFYCDLHAVTKTGTSDVAVLVGR
jgi:hypothetical protein